MRLFSALPLAPECVDRLTRFRLRSSVPGDGLRWSTPEQWHLTLCFFGEVGEDQSRCLEASFQRLHAAAPTLTLANLDLFGTKGILIAAVEPTPLLLNLSARVTACGESCGIALESRPFRPHISLARSKGRTGDATLKNLSRTGLPSLGPELRWTPMECHLLESFLSPQGAEYTVRSRVVLGQSDVPSVDGL